MKKIKVFLVLICMLLSGCMNHDQKDKTNLSQEKESLQIGMSFDSFVIERWQRDRDVFVSTAKEFGAVVNVRSANGDVETQISQIEYFIEKRMDAIIIICIDMDQLKGVVQKAKDANIKVVAYDRLIRNADVDLYISFDNEAVGTMMAQAIVGQDLEKKKVLMIGGPLTDLNVTMVESGFCKVMEEAKIELVGNFHAAGWKPELASVYIDSNSTFLEEVDAIMCGNDSLAGQVVYSLAERRLAGKVYVVGQDADLEACQRIVEGTQLMTVYKPVEKLAQKAAEYTIKLIKGEELEETQTIDDGTYDVPYVTLETIAVTEDNMMEVIINSSFHLKEDVYLNVPDKMPE